MAAPKKKFDGSSLSNYVEVDVRIQDFYAKFPEGSLAVDGEIEPIEIDGKRFLKCRVLAFRHDNDDQPAAGTAWEPFPGTTPYTRNSEAMNAETSAWGRAIVAAGIPAKGSIASANEVRNRQAEREADKPTRKPAAKKAPTTPKPDPETAPESDPAPGATLAELRAEFTASKLKVDDLRWLLTSVGVEDTTDTRAAMKALKPEQINELMAEFTKARKTAEASA